MSPHQASKKHHFVPECYLKQFTVNNVFFTLDMNKVRLGHMLKPTLTNPSKICYLPNYYSINEDEQSDSFSLNSFSKLFIEKEALKNLEDKYLRLFSSLTTNNQMTIEDAIDLADFIIQLKIRNPHWKDNTIETKKEEWIINSMDDIREKVKTDNRFSKIPDCTKNKLFNSLLLKNLSNPDLGKKIQQFGLAERHLNKANNNSKSRNAIVNCHWNILLAPKEGPYFITSDNPGVAIDKNNKSFNCKFNDDFIFILPLSPKHCLLIGDQIMDNSLALNHTIKYFKSGEISKDHVIVINNLMLRHINKLLISCDSWYLSEIAKLNFKERNK